MNPVVSRKSRAVAFVRDDTEVVSGVRALAPGYWRLVGVLEGEAGREGLRARELAGRLVLELVPGKVEGGAVEGEAAGGARPAGGGAAGGVHAAAVGRLTRPGNLRV